MSDGTALLHSDEQPSAADPPSPTPPRALRSSSSSSSSSSSDATVRKLDYLVLFFAVVVAVVIISVGASSRRPSTALPPLAACTGRVAGTNSTLADMQGYYDALARHAAAAQLPLQRNLILMLADGFGPAVVTFAREIKAAAAGRTDGAATLALDSTIQGTIQTRSADSIITDSAAGATAYASATRTFNGGIGVVGPSAETVSPVATLLEIAKAAGYSTGVVVTSRLTHATPACFTAHASNRGDEYFIAWQQVTQVPLPDVMLGGGKDIFTEAAVNNRTLLQLARERGCRDISNAAQLAQVLADPSAYATKPLLGLFSPNHMPYVIDKSDTPSLSDMVKAALAVLKAKGKPFVLFVEGSRIDHALHDNDAAAAAQEALAYDDAFAAAVAFAKDNNAAGKSSGISATTTVVSVADHSTGGITLGAQIPGDPSCYPPYVWNASQISRFKGSTYSVVESVCSVPPKRSLCTAMRGATDFAIDDKLCGDLDADAGKAVCISTRDASCCQECWQRIQAIIADMYRVQTRVSFSTFGHTGEDINMYAYGAQASVFKGNMKNSDVGTKLFEVLGLLPFLKSTSDALSSCNISTSSKQIPQAATWPPPKTGPA